MSTLRDRMSWAAGDQSPELSLDEVLGMLDVADRDEPSQRAAVREAVARDRLGRPSLRALERAGWLDDAETGPTMENSEGASEPQVLRRAPRPKTKSREGFAARALAVLDVVGTVARAAWILTLGGFLLVNPKRAGGTSGVALRLLLAAVRFCVFWALIWLALLLLDPTLIVGSSAGLQTLFQVLPATTVALLVLVLGSLFVVVQIVVQLWGTRSTVMVGLDEQVQSLIMRPLFIVSATLVLAGQVPDSGSPDHAVTAAAAVLAFATVGVFYGAALALPALAQRYTLPRGFPQYVIADLDREFASGTLGLTVFRVSLLTEALRLAIRRGDSVAVGRLIESLTLFHRAYLDALAEDPGVRAYRVDDPEDPTDRDTWFVDDLIPGLVAGVEEGLRAGGSAADLNALASLAGGVAKRALEAGEPHDASRAIDGLIEMGTLTQQVSGFINHFSEPAGQLAFIEAEAERKGYRDLAARALSGWALLISYSAWHLRLDTPHPLVLRSLECFGDAPPWEAASELLHSSEWQRDWANKQYYGPEVVAVFLPVVAEGFEVRHDREAVTAWWERFHEFVAIVVHGPPDAE